MSDYALEWRGDVLVLLDRDEPRSSPLSVDWVTPLRALRSFPDSRKGPMGRAVGRKTKSVIDATAGFGGDSLRLMMMGYAVTMLERSPVVCALLADGLRRLRAHPELLAMLAAPPTLRCCDALSALPAMAADAVFLDPMFPPRAKSSVLSKRPLRVLGELAGKQASYDELVSAARRADTRRIVVKRPDHIKAPSPAPDETFAGKLVRYDVSFVL